MALSTSTISINSSSWTELSGATSTQITVQNKGRYPIEIYVGTDTPDSNDNGLTIGIASGSDSVIISDMTGESVYGRGSGEVVVVKD